MLETVERHASGRNGQDSLMMIRLLLQRQADPTLHFLPNGLVFIRPWCLYYKQPSRALKTSTININPNLTCVLHK
jgi:hypothetical protein